MTTFVTVRRRANCAHCQQPATARDALVRIHEIANFGYGDLGAMLREIARIAEASIELRDLP